MSILRQHFYHKETGTLSYIVYDSDTLDAVIIDPVWDYNLESNELSDLSAKEILAFVKLKSLRVYYILETHVHADHVTAAQLLKKDLPDSRVCISENIRKVQQTFNGIINFPKNFKTDGSQFDHLILNNEVLRAGSFNIYTIPTPGHTPSCLSYLISNLVFTGDALFMPDSGTGRCDFPGGSADELYQSIHQKLYALPKLTCVLTGHDYMPNGRTLVYESTIEEEMTSNIHIKETTLRKTYVDFRSERDKSLKEPRLLRPSLFVNMQGRDFKPEMLLQHLVTQRVKDS